MIKAIHMTKRLGNNLALNDVNLTAEEGKIYGITGTRESGRSTLLKVLAGIFKPDMGEALINGENIYENERIMSQIFFMPEEMYFPKRKDFSKIEAFYNGYYLAWNHDYYLELVSKLGLDHNKRVADLGAEDRRLAAWCCAFASQAKYLFLDAAFRDITPSKREILDQELSAYAKERQACVMLSTQEDEKDFYHADWYGCMFEGLLKPWEEREIFEEYKSEIREKMGSADRRGGDEHEE